VAVALVAAPAASRIWWGNKIELRIDWEKTSRTIQTFSKEALVTVLYRRWVSGWATLYIDRLTPEE
jgi:hypothetical protein